MKGTLRIIAVAVIALVVLVVVVLRVTAPGAEPAYNIGPALNPGIVQPQLALSYMDDAVMLAPDGSLWFWGGRQSLFHNALLNGPVISTPALLDGRHDWRKVALVSVRVAAIKADGTLWTWDGSGPVTPPLTPKQLGSDSDWVEVSGHTSHLMALKKDGTLWGWGQNESCQVGGPATNMIKMPVQVGTDRDWKIISAGAFNSYAIKTDGTLWEWGYCLLPPGTNIQNPAQLDPGLNWVAVSAGDFHVLALKSDGTLWVAGQATLLGPASAQMKQIGTDRDWVEIHSGQNCFFARKADGSWWGAGANWMGPTGMPGVNTSLPKRLPYAFESWAFAAGGETTVELGKDGQLWSMGKRVGSAKPGTRWMQVKAFLGAVKDRIIAPKPATGPVAGTPGPEFFDFAPHLIWTVPSGMQREMVKEAAGTNVVGANGE